MKPSKPPAVERAERRVVRAAMRWAYAPWYRSREELFLEKSCDALKHARRAGRRKR